LATRPLAAAAPVPWRTAAASLRRPSPIAAGPSPAAAPACRWLLPVLLLAACAAPKPLPLLRPAADLDRDVRAVVAGLGPNVRAAVWLSDAGGPPAYAWNVDQPLPVASAIKAAYLVELFAEFAADLDAPFPGADQLLADQGHPAVRDFRPAQRATARQALGGASVRRIGKAMIASKDVDNATYNLAANLVTAHFGGPAWLEARLHRRHPELLGLHVRRYMLADRRQNGDNEATARALACTHRMLARGRVPGVPDGAIAAARTVLQRADGASGHRRFQKNGALDSPPVTRTVGGFREGPCGTAVYVIMLARDGEPAGGLAAAGQELGAAVATIEALLLAAAP
jgi:hypothetical protein